MGGGSEPPPKTPIAIISGTGRATKYELQVLPEHSQSPCEQKYIKIFGEKGAWAYRGTAQIFWVPPIIPGTGKATDFEFGQYIHRVPSNENPLKFLEKRESGHIQGLPNFLATPYYLWKG